MATKKAEPRYVRRRIDTEEQGDDWLLTYSDAVTLLMTFLVLLLSVSTIDQSKYEQAVEAIKESGLNREEKYVSPFEVLKENLDTISAEHGMQGKMAVSRQPKGVTIELSSSSLYPVGSAEIQGASASTLREVANAIKGFDYDNYQVEIEGHTDNVAIHTLQYPSNWELSVHRATNIVRFLTVEGVDPKRMKAAGYADTRPKVPNEDAYGNPIPDNQAVNRRIVINVIRSDG